MIKLSLKGFADFMSAGPAKQRSILRQYKFPDEDEARAKIVYYREARDRISVYHKTGKTADWLEKEAKGIAALAAGSAGRTKDRLNHNARALLQYQTYFASCVYKVLAEVALRYSIGDVVISVVPDLHVTEDGKEKLIKFEFSKEPPAERLTKVICQLMFQASQDAGLGFPSSSILYIDVPRNKVHKGARAGARIRNDLEATCKNISALWPTI